MILVSFLLLIHQSTFCAPLNKPYELIFGRQDASQQYQQLAAQALSDFQVPNAARVPIKQMNKVAGALFSEQFISFTLFGIWINEELLNRLPQEGREWAIYHEAAHYALNHHAKALLIGGLPLALIARNFYKDYITRNSSKIVSATIGTLSTYAWYELWLKNLIRSQELQADQSAARLLIHLGKKNIVEYHLKALQSDIQHYELSDEWHFDPEIHYQSIADILYCYY